MCVCDGCGCYQSDVKEVCGGRHPHQSDAVKVCDERDAIVGFSDGMRWSGTDRAGLDAGDQEGGGAALRLLRVLPREEPQQRHPRRRVQVRQLGLPRPHLLSSAPF
eukprot:2547453-Rhodomonas_salina.1